MGEGAYRDAGAALARVAALEGEIEELRSELARLRDAERGRSTEKNDAPRAEDLRKLRDEVVNLRAENELLRGARESAALASERDELVRELVGLKNSVAALTEENDRLRAEVATHVEGARAETTDNRDAVIKRLHEEREDLARELEEVRARYEAEPPASRNPKTLEEKVLAILSRLVK